MTSTTDDKKYLDFIPVRLHDHALFHGVSSDVAQQIPNRDAWNDREEFLKFSRLGWQSRFRLFILIVNS